MPAERSTAESQLERILYILPAAARADGVPVDVLAAELGVSPKQVIADIAEATGRAWHHPGGAIEPFSIFITRRRVFVRTDGDFDRPVRLSSREKLALGLGLRALAAEADAARRARILGLADRLEASIVAEDFSPAVPDGVEYEAHELVLGDDELRGIIGDAIVARMLCDVQYLKPGGTPVPRRLAPYRLVYADGAWYVAAYDVERDGLRFFRMDRLLAAAPLDEQQPPPPPEFDDWLATAPFHAEDELEVAVRYDAAVAPWLRERLQGSDDDDGGYVVRHRVADSGWLARHVLQYAGAAVVQEPRQAAAWVVQAAERIVRS